MDEDPQVVEVLSCDMQGETSCIIEVWYLRWDGKALSRTGCRYIITRWNGKRPLSVLPFRPLLALDLDVVFEGGACALKPKS